MVKFSNSSILLRFSQTFFIWLQMISGGRLSNLVKIERKLWAWRPIKGRHDKRLAVFRAIKKNSNLISDDSFTFVVTKFPQELYEVTCRAFVLYDVPRLIFDVMTSQNVKNIYWSITLEQIFVESPGLAWNVPWRLIQQIKVKRSRSRGKKL